MSPDLSETPLPSSSSTASRRLLATCVSSGLRSAAFATSSGSGIRGNLRTYSRPHGSGTRFRRVWRTLSAGLSGPSTICPPVSARFYRIRVVRILSQRQNEAGGHDLGRIQFQTGYPGFEEPRVSSSFRRSEISSTGSPGKPESPPFFMRGAALERWVTAGPFLPRGPGNPAEMPGRSDGEVTVPGNDSPEAGGTDNRACLGVLDGLKGSIASSRTP